MTEICYSIDEEDFSYTELADAVEAAFDFPEAVVGSIQSVWKGEAVPHKASDFLVTENLLDDMSERAYEAGEELSEDWIERLNKKCTNAQVDDLTDRLACVIDSWAIEHGLQPTFYAVENVKKLRVRLTSEDGNWEEVE